MRSFLPFLLLLPARVGVADTLAWDPTLAPPTVEFTALEQEALAAGEVVYKVQDVDPNHLVGVSATVTSAPASVIWKHILDFDAYVTFLPYVTGSQTQSRDPVDGGEAITARLELTTLGMVTRYTMENHWYPERGFLNWVLVPRAANPLNRVRGSWQVEPLEGTPNRCLLIYRADADLRWWVPDFLQARATDRGLAVFVKLIRKRAEAQVG